MNLLGVKSNSLHGKIIVHAAAACVQLLYAGFQVLASIALSNGASRTIFPVYRNTIAALSVGIMAFFAERKSRPALTFTKFAQLFLAGFIGVCINQLLFLSGLYYTSAMFVTTIQNLTPIVTFIVAMLFGIEKLQLRKPEGRAKLLGVLIGSGGATLIAFYRGPSFIDEVESFLLSFTSQQEAVEFKPFVSIRMGILVLLGNCSTWAVWFILQGPILRDYPAHLSATAFTYLFGSVQLAILAVSFERNLDTWAATFYSDLPALLYGGLVASGVAMTLQGWCAYRGGPVIVAAYQPLQTIFVAILSLLFLHESFHLGSLIGGLLITIGLYLVVWGKGREWRLSEVQDPLIHNSISENLELEALNKPLLS
ncbi:hypothetical protein KP509_33G043800 [Ceratopteris richardii]|uniref:WAT1-related protein n=1 Tax=Ceratopteris richardii TaxID=49495 RepID=A0A8T2QP38_CERRI|nr:hypothetical protein KP509_33G043800 [Ceratopteris richardii]